jgi:lipopolysaccharide/colanic/teichoic acid biosynthesis glycosyltransferase
MREYTGKPKSGRHTFVKRIMDVSIASTALVLGAPFLALIALAIRLDTPGPILFKQKRHGFNNRVFDVYKFRSFRTDVADPLAKNQVIKGDGRITRVGKFIRNTSIDELPQLLNVIKGEMSLVGPRPHAVGMHTGNIETYRLVDEYAHRHKVKPGMTGWAQINGSRGPLHDADSVALRVKLDLEYIERSNWWYDLIIMAKTIPCLLGDSENVR